MTVHWAAPEPEVPFEDIIFEEAGFLAAGESVITIKVDDKVVVSFPADTDVSVIAKFVKKLGKEEGHWGLEQGLRLWVCQSPVSMHCGIRGLSQMVWSWKGHSPASGDVYVFFSKDRKMMKALRWDGDGFLIITVR